MMKRPIPKSSGLYCKTIDPTQTGKRRKFTAEDNLWLEVLGRSAVYKEMADKDVRAQLSDVGFPDYLIDAFLASRLPVSFESAVL